ncbi:MAG TPA: hypothetical protein VHG92_01530, partial [Afifellaceae bacterium]|nr:hypothetical protein [Afifellaceae bacterium]
MALQEVDSRRCWRDKHPFDQFEYLAEATGMEPLPGQNIITHRGCFGNVLLTRLPVRGVKRRDISVDRREPRGVIAARIDAGPHRLNVIATHLGVSLRERRRQVAKLMDIVE